MNLGVERTGEWAGSLKRTGIDKRPAGGRVMLRRLGVDGDVIIDMKNHGGEDQAVYAYAREDAAWWAKELDREIAPGGFGENLSTSGLDITGALIGERWAIGDAVVEVASVRIPCRTFAGFWDVKDLIKRFTNRAVPGAYLRVIEEGAVGAGDAIEVVHRPVEHDLTVGELFRALTTEPELLPKVLTASAVAANVREKAEKRVG
ncbi:molybdenum cofactor biosynthesis protein [Actinorhabdospora filicis]|uniref:Molybdenum cofactor biosynthesis protein n=1 Tax=Actinorhabdospora filicis TaxID=1785913 RepID=A0A9W6SLW7_9ACTN|nr:molybdenum cofactor biosynthesis protein [Actinorhabdospora filicis]